MNQSKEALINWLLLRVRMLDFRWVVKLDKDRIQNPSDDRANMRTDNGYPEEIVVPNTVTKEKNILMAIEIFFKDKKSIP